MSKEFPFINEEAEGLREGNKVHEAKYYAESLQNGCLQTLIGNFLALSGSWYSFTSDPTQEEFLDLSSIFSPGSNGVTEIQ